MKTPQLLDRWGNPVRRETLTTEVAAPTVTGIRSPLSGYPADGLNPLRLAAILRDADAGDPLRYLELAETIEERDPHYMGVLGTRRRSVSQIGVTVEPASDAQEDEDRAAMVRTWLKRDELADELFHILDCIGKGFSFTEIVWDTSSGQWMPDRLKRRDPRWFRFARHDLETPLLLDPNGQARPLDAFRFIHATIQAKSGLALRGGLARVAAWGWMFKAFTQRDWAVFTQTYGQPLRVGKWGPGASEADKETLFRAVANIAGDCAAIIPETMTIDFVETKSVGATADLYRQRADWLDQQISKAVLGQTATTDAIAGGHAVGREHRSVQEDIERADARALAAILNRDLVRPWMQLEFGPLPAYPRIVIARPEKEDLTALAQALGTLVPLGLRVGQAEVRSRFGLAEPGPEDAVLEPRAAPVPATATPPEGAEAEPSGRGSPIERQSGAIKGGFRSGRPVTALNAEGAPGAVFEGGEAEAILAARLELEAGPQVGRMIARIEAMLEAATSLQELQAMLLAGFPDLDAAGLAEVLALAMTAGTLGGRAAVAEEAAGEAAGA